MSGATSAIMSRMSATPNCSSSAYFRAPRYEEVSLSNWLTHTPPRLVAQHFNVDEKLIAQWPDNSPGVMPKART